MAFYVLRGVTATVIVWLDVRVPHVPVTVICVALTTAELAADRVSVLAVVIVAGLNDAVTPAGKPVTPNTTGPLKPPCGTTLNAVLPVAPAATLTLETVAASLKL